MRIPPSAIVMTLVVAVPFGFAVRDTLKGNDAQTKQEREEAEMRADEQKQHDREVAEQQAQYEREKKLNAEREETFATVIGKQPATLGERFGGVQVGDRAPSSFDDRLGEIDSVLDVNHGLQLRGDDTIASVSFTFGDAHCDRVREIVNAAWGPATDGGDLWIDRAHQRRASLTGLLCVLHFDLIVDDAAWAKAAIPKLLGKTPAQAKRQLGMPTVPLDEPTLSWFLPGPPSGHDSTELRADVTDGKIVLTSASATVTQPEALAIIDAIGKQLGKPATNQDGAMWSWTRPDVSVHYDEDSMLLSVVSE